ncbi:flagellar export protein FliJ [Planococcus koreensis]|uniref:flagellar export protein FliJ n=1 Tax=Planococcus koreensis TaxID=112331 RepID=UPI0039FBDCEF
MAQFNFRFQKILDLKENEKGAAQLQMADAIKLQQAGYERNEAIYKKIIDAEHLKKAKQEDGINISELRMLVNYIHQLQEQLLASNRELELLQSNVARSQNQLQRKAQEEKTWDSLKQQKHSQFVEHNKTAEQHYFDELAGTRFYRTNQAASERG